MIHDQPLTVVAAMEIGSGREVMDRADVLAEEQVQRPIEGDANLLVEARQFAQVNRAP
jgi:hypothetical protein